MSGYELAHLNIARIKAPLDSAVMADFVNNLEAINALADQSPGFVWRLETDDAEVAGLGPLDDENLLVNISVWRDVEALYNYVYRSAHLGMMRRRREWFEPVPGSPLVLWWVPAGHRPSTVDASARRALLERKGPTADAFTFREVFGPPDALESAHPLKFSDARSIE